MSNRWLYQKTGVPIEVTVLYIGIDPIYGRVAKCKTVRNETIDVSEKYLLTFDEVSAKVDSVLEDCRQLRIWKKENANN